jgi:hypothetical protein
LQDNKPAKPTTINKSQKADLKKIKNDNNSVINKAIKPKLIGSSSEYHKNITPRI